MSSDFTKSPKAILVDLINSTNNTDYPVTLFSFDIPASLNNTHESGCDTEVLVSGSLTSSWSGSLLFQYNRVNLSTVPGNRSVNFTITPSIDKLSELIPLINARYGINITTDDYMEDDLPVLEPGSSVNYSFPAAMRSLVFNGSLNLILSRAASSGNTVIPLSNLITNTNLDIFNYTPS